MTMSVELIGLTLPHSSRLLLIDYQRNASRARPPMLSAQSVRSLLAEHFSLAWTFKISFFLACKDTTLTFAHSRRTTSHVRRLLVQLCAGCTWQARRWLPPEVSAPAERVSAQTTHSSSASRCDRSQLLTCRVGWRKYCNRPYRPPSGFV